MYKKGVGGAPSDVVRAAELYQDACDQGGPSFCAKLGLLYEMGESGITSNPAQAVALYRKACEAKVELGCEGLKRLKLH